MPKHNVLYRMHSAEQELLYVGMTMNPHLRFQDHRIQKSWWSDVAHISLEHFASRDELIAAERTAIASENPRWNSVRYRTEPRPHALPRRRRYSLTAAEVAALRAKTEVA